MNLDRDILIHLPAVLAVARCQSFAAASKELKMSPSAVSHAVRAVEERLGLPLFARTTRSVSLTETGRSFVAATATATSDIADAIESARADQNRVAGLLRLNVPMPALSMGIDRIVRETVRRHADLRVEVFCDNSLSDIVADGFDIGVRIGTMVAEDMVAIRMTPPIRSLLVAAPSYLEKYGTPTCVADLQSHNCITYRKRKDGPIYDWTLMEDGGAVDLRVRGTFIVNEASYARQLVLDGVGIIYAYDRLVEDELADGSLVEVLPETRVEKPGLYLYYPQRASRTPKVRAFIDIAREIMAPELRRYDQEAAE
ncbi:LysR substrate-binding domain-containing protein [Pacificispira spongiicola]|uniref:LysR substrate-binding domain-containing protein n=1 Tax=Pacificispira spongiicola TaxID=2729598 RepID=UPI001D0C01D6|nr:LysR substrate-binding domain-containing protein [Pacificispira spongiicola]